MDDLCKVDLGKTDVYEGNVPDADIETTLKVLRTIRNASLGPKVFLANTAVILTHAHAAIHQMIKQVQTAEAAGQTENIKVEDYKEGD